MIDTPILLVIFKRPEATRRVLHAIAQAKPRILLVAADGPRNDQEAAQCDASRAVIGEVDWDCEIRTHFSDTNLGCGVRVYTAIDWALAQFEEVIILEDDCVPHPSFFTFCQSMLSRYRDDTRIMHISGNNFLPPGFDIKESYYFSKYSHAWGWATWRRAWNHFDWSLKRWPDAERRGLLDVWCESSYEKKFWKSIFDRMLMGATDVWDYQWNFSIWAQNGLVVLPTLNLVSNIGSGRDATHTEGDSPCLNLPVFALDHLVHPPLMIRNARADSCIFDQNYGGAEMKRAASTHARWRRLLGPFLMPLRMLRKLRASW
jgi:hypothetical protein